MLRLEAESARVVLRKERWASEYGFREEEEVALYSEHTSIEELPRPAILPS